MGNCYTSDGVRFAGRKGSLLSAALAIISGIPPSWTRGEAGLGPDHPGRFLHVEPLGNIFAPNCWMRCRIELARASPARRTGRQAA